MRLNKTFLFSIGILFSAWSAKADNILPIEEIFDQGGSQWCWAYSAYHTLRTFYTVAMGDPTVVPGVWDWHSVLLELDASDKFRDFMGNHFSEGRTGNPHEFIKLMEKEHPELKDAGWQEYYPGNRESVRYRALTRAEQATATRLDTSGILGKVHVNLKKGVPSVFCNPQHCMMIFGDKGDGDQPKGFEIADSIGSRIHHYSFGQAESSLDLVVTLP